MFRIVRDRHWTTEVAINVPGSGGPGVPAETRPVLPVTFREIGHERLAALTAQGDVALLREVLVEAGPVGDEDGNVLPWSDALREQLIDIPYVAAALAFAYAHEVFGAAAKN